MACSEATGRGLLASLLRNTAPALAVLSCALATAAPASAQVQARRLGGEGALSDPGFSALVVVWDEVGWESVRNSYTPTFDELASRGLVLERFYAMPNCSPTRACLHSGLLPFRTGVGKVLASVNPGSDEFVPAAPAFTLASVTEQTAVIGKWHLDVAPSNLAALDWEYSSWLAGTWGNLRTQSGESYGRWTRLDDGNATRTGQYPTLAQIQAAEQWWNTTPGSKLLVVQFNDAHGPPHTPPTALLPQPSDHPSFAVRSFRDAVQAADLATGMLLDAIDADLVIVFGDNGTPAGSEPEIPDDRGKNSIFESGIRVPAVVVGEGVRQGVTRKLASVVDILPTLADYFDQPGPAFTDGVSQRGLFEKEDEYRSFVYAQAFRPNGFGPRDRNDEVVVGERYKLIRRTDGAELFIDLDNDPDERAPLDPAANPAEYRRLTDIIEELGG